MGGCDVVAKWNCLLLYKAKHVMTGLPETQGEVGSVCMFKSGAVEIEESVIVFH